MKQKPFLQRPDTICGSPFFPFVFIPLAFCFLLIYSYTTSPLYVGEGMDSSIFKTVGLGITQGKLLYTDIFDHKGPLVFFINALGQMIIPGRNGIFLLQIISLSVTLLFLFRTACLFIKPFFAFLTQLLVLFVLGGLFLEGNQCEEWTLPFIAIPLYYSLRHLVVSPDKSHNPRYCFLYGICFGIAFYIRPNDAIAFVGGIMTGLSIEMLLRREWGLFFKNAVAFFGGFFLICIPVIGYFLYHHNFGDFILGTFSFNMKYSGSFLESVASIFGHGKLCLGLILLTTLLLVADNNYKKALFVVIPVCGFTLLLIGTLLYRHYFIILIPVLTIYIALLFKERNPALLILAVAIIICVPATEKSLVKQGRQALSDRFFSLRTHQEQIRILYAHTNALLDIIPLEDRDSVLNFNLKYTQIDGLNSTDGDGYVAHSSIFFHKGMVPCNRFQMVAHDYELLQEDNIIRKNPKWIITDDEPWIDKGDEEWDYLHNHYSIAAQTDKQVVGLTLWKRNDYSSF